MLLPPCVSLLVRCRWCGSVGLRGGGFSTLVSWVGGLHVCRLHGVVQGAELYGDGTLCMVCDTWVKCTNSGRDNSDSNLRVGAQT